MFVRSWKKTPASSQRTGSFCLPEKISGNSRRKIKNNKLAANKKGFLPRAYDSIGQPVMAITEVMIREVIQVIARNLQQSFFEFFPGKAEQAVDVGYSKVLPEV